MPKSATETETDRNAEWARHRREARALLATRNGLRGIPTGAAFEACARAFVEGVVSKHPECDVVETLATLYAGAAFAALDARAEGAP